MKKLTIEQLCQRFQTTPARLAVQFRKNGAQMQEMADKAALTGKKVNGYSHVQLVAHVADCIARAQEAEAMGG